jgi:hypothetical protein
MAYVPYALDEIALTEDRLAAMSSEDPMAYDGGDTFHNEVAFRSIDHQWRPILRGRQKEHYDYNGDASPAEFRLNRKVIRSDGALVTDFAICTTWGREENALPFVYSDWVIGFFANSLISIANTLNLSPASGNGLIRVAFDIGGEIELLVEERFARSYPFPVGYLNVPDFELLAPNGVDQIFQQLQIDLFSIVGRMPPRLWSLNKPE